LVTHFVPGEKITRVLDRLAAQRALGDTAAQPRITALLAHVLESYARQVLEVGVFQADPHPGNLLADEQGNVTVLDFGCAKQLSDEERSRLLALLGAIVLRDSARMAEALEQLGFRTRSGTREGLVAYAKNALEQLALVSGDGFRDQDELLTRVAAFGRFMHGDPIEQLPESFVMLGRVFGTLSGLFAHYRPDVSATARVLPIVLSALAGSARAA
ncbi:MAG TPA: AarF/UbiB family protein, partial [Polyangiales bacterium]